MLEVRRGTPEDFDAVLDFYTQMIDQMRGTDFDVLWEHDKHPSPAFMRTSLEQDRVYLGWATSGENDGEGEDQTELACAMIVNADGADGYDQTEWGCSATPDELGVLHVVATLPKYHGQGFARTLLTEVIEQERAAGTKALRLDTFPYNVRGRGLYESLGFDYRGDITLWYPALGDVVLSMYELVL